MDGYEVVFMMSWILAIFFLCWRDVKKRKNSKKKKYYNDMEYASWKKRNVIADKEIQYCKYYTQVYTILTPTEQRFYSQLKQALKDYNVEIHYKVRLADIFRVKYSNKYYITNFNRISAKHTDFIITETDVAKPILAIELDDSSHDLIASEKNDEFKNQLYANSNIKLLRFKVQYRYDLSEIKHRLFKYAKASHRDNIDVSVISGKEVN